MADKAILEHVAVNASSPIPLFVQLSTNLRKQITDGQLPSGTPLPTVQALAKRCGMSQATVMRAITELASEGLIVTRRGARSVVAARQAASTEILFGGLTQALTPRDISFFNQLLDGLREGYHDPDRRFLTTYIDAAPMHADELLRMCQVGRADGIVAYRPMGLAADALREAARAIPVVALFYPVPKAPVDCVRVDPVPALRELLRSRIAQGKRRFCYIGALTRFMQEPGEYSPYVGIYRTAAEIVRGAGLEFSEIDIVDGKNEAEWPKIGRSIPDGTVLVASNPRLAIACEGDRGRLDLISYTEYRGSVDLAAGRVTTLYMGLETVGAAAAELLKSRVRTGNASPARTVTLNPKVIPAAAGVA